MALVNFAHLHSSLLLYSREPTQDSPGLQLCLFLLVFVNLRLTAKAKWLAQGFGFVSVRGCLVIRSLG